MPAHLTARADLTVLKNLLFDITSASPYGEEFTYPALTEILGENAQAKRGRAMVLAVSRRLERQAQRTLVCIRGVGYRIARPEEHVHLGSRYQEQGRRRMNRAVRVLEATPIQQLTPAERQRHDAFLAIVYHQVDTLRSVKQRVEVAHQEVSALIEAQLAEATERLHHLRGGTPAG